METLLPNIESSYLNMDNEIDNALTNDSFDKCLNGSEKVNAKIQPLFNLLVE